MPALTLPEAIEMKVALSALKKASTPKKVQSVSPSLAANVLGASGAKLITSYKKALDEKMSGAPDKTGKKAEKLKKMSERLDAMICAKKSKVEEKIVKLKQKEADKVAKKKVAEAKKKAAAAAKKKASPKSPKARKPRAKKSSVASFMFGGDSDSEYDSDEDYSDSDLEFMN
jgi:hypothetical protein